MSAPRTPLDWARDFVHCPAFGRQSVYHPKLGRCIHLWPDIDSRFCWETIARGQDGTRWRDRYGDLLAYDDTQEVT